MNTSYQAVRETYRNAYTPWTREDDCKLAQEFKAGVSIGDLAQMFGRQPSAITSRLAKIGLIEQQFTPTKTTEKPVNEVEIVYDPKVALLTLVYCEAYRRVFGEPHYASQRLLVELQQRQPRNRRLLQAFISLQQWLESNDIEIKRDNVLLESYISFCFEFWAGFMIRPFPAKLKSRAMLHNYLRKPRPEEQP